MYKIKIPRFEFNYEINTPDLIFNYPVQKANANKPTIKHTKQFYKNKHQIIPTILSVTEPHEVIHGERAVQKYVKKDYHRHTTDIDILTHTPREDAYEAEKKLDKKLGGDIFYVEQGQHTSTWRVKSRTDGQAYADYTRPEDGIMPPFKRIGKYNFVTKNYIKKHNTQTLQNPDVSFRHSKDKDTLNRLKIGKRR